MASTGTRKRRTREVVLEIPIPVGGINMAVSYDKLRSIESPDIGGFEFDEFGSLGVPWPAKNLGSTAGGCLSAHIFQRESGSTQLIAHFTDGSVRYSTDFHTTSGSATWTSIATGLSTTAPMYFETFLDAVFMSNGVNDYRRWDGATQTTYASAPKGKFLTVWRDTMWQSGVSGNPDRVYQSAAGDATTWPAANFIDIEKGRGFAVTGLAATDAALVVFKFLKHFVIYDPVEYTNRLVDPDKGCIDHFSIVFHDGQMYFVSHRGVCRYLGDAGGEIVSQNIGPIFERLEQYTTSGPVHDLTLPPIWGYSYQNHVGWNFDVANIYHFAYYPGLPEQPWMRHAHMSNRMGLSLREKTKQEELFSLERGPNGLLRHYDQSTPSSTIECRWKTPWFDFDNPTLEKYLYLIQLLGRGRITSIEIHRDYDEALDYTAAAATMSDIEHKEIPFYVDAYGRSFSFEFTASTLDISGAGETRQFISSGDGQTQMHVGRNATSINRVLVHARLISDMLR